MFAKCIPCNKIGVSCVPNLMLLPFPELIQWCIKPKRIYIILRYGYQKRYIIV